MVETIPNFLHPNTHALLQKRTCEFHNDPPRLPYFFSPGVLKVNDGNFFFCHHLLDKEAHLVSEYFHEVGGPILGKLNFNIIHRMKVNLYTNRGRQDKHGFHVDMPWIDHKILLYCLNTNNGFTEFEDGSKLPSIANQAYIFDGKIKHQSVSQTDTDIRVNVNVVFN